MSLLLGLDMFFMMAMISVKNALERFSHHSFSQGFHFDFDVCVPS